MIIIHKQLLFQVTVFNTNNLDMYGLTLDLQA